ncbi:hypothetical protein LCGC14_0267030 [marine sediment metagenome]|uniref:Uncharacterized protein n=1 Tax=marine sediment metagenome TaxID=412755 RepID=A0A0F9UGN1_9ZZZZ
MIPLFRHPQFIGSGDLGELLECHNAMWALIFHVLNFLLDHSSQADYWALYISTGKYSIVNHLFVPRPSQLLVTSYDLYQENESGHA